MKEMYVMQNMYAEHIPPFNYQGSIHFNIYSLLASR